MRDWEAEAKIETAKAMASYRTAARKIERAIDEFRATGGEYETFTTINRQIIKLEDRANKPEIRGDVEAREEAWAITKALRERNRAAEGPAAEARQAARHREIADIKEREREERAAFDKKNPGLRQYLDERKLAASRGR